MAAQISISNIFVLPPLFFFFFLINISTLTIASSLSFNFTTFAHTANINMSYERAFEEESRIELTGTWDNQQRNSAGRATYIQPLHLWDRGSGNLSSFETSFTFAIDSKTRTSYGDGLTFFFAPQGSRLDDSRIARGGGLGVGILDKLANSTKNPFFAVEFDTFSNPGYKDLPIEHVGIDIDSMISVNSTIWSCDIMGGKNNSAWINYDSISHNLNVTFTGFLDNKTIIQQLHYVVDLRLNLPEFVTFGFSAATGDSYATHTIYTWDFKSTLNLAPTPSPTPSPTPINLAPIPSLDINVGLVVGLSVGASVLVGGLIIVWMIFGRKKEIMEEDDVVLDDNEFERGTGPRKFSYNELVRATNNFREDEKLGEGGFGGVYRGFIRDLNCYVAVKKVSKGSRQGIKEYASEVKIISQLRHRNLVQLIGWCHERGELMLVYEFMPNGSLDAHLFKEDSFLKWEFRYTIAQGIATALLYLHEEWEKCVVHRDIKSSNVMLDLNFNSKVGDFGLARLVDHAKGSQTTIIAGTIGYMAPECATTGRASKESDVYSFGIVALEIACGRRPVIPNEEQGKIVMVEWVWELYGFGKVLEAMDPKLRGSVELDDRQQREVECLMVVGLWCAHPDSNCRPSIRQAIQVMKFEAPLPLLPSKLPTPSYDQSFPINKSIAFSSSLSITQNGDASCTGNSSNSSNVFTGSSQETACLL